MLELLHDYQRQIQLIPRAIILGIIMLFMYMYIRDNCCIKKAIKVLVCERWKFMFFIYCGFIMMVTIFSRDKINPFQNVFSGFGLFKKDKCNYELIENITLFVPYTFLYLQAFKPTNSWKSTIKITVLSTVFIETFQLLFWVGEFQFSDMIHNEIGSIIGYSIWILFRQINKHK